MIFQSDWPVCEYVKNCFSSFLCNSEENLQRHSLQRPFSSFCVGRRGKFEKKLVQMEIILGKKKNVSTTVTWKQYVTTHKLDRN